MNERAYYADHLERGKEFQDFVQELLAHKLMWCLLVYTSRARQRSGESAAGVEIKFDEKCHDTGNLFIETEDRPHSGAAWRLGAVLNPESWFVVIGDYDEVFGLSRRRLEAASRSGRYRAVETNDLSTGRGFLIPLEEARRICDWRWDKETDRLDWRGGQQ